MTRDGTTSGMDRCRTSAPAPYLCSHRAILGPKVQDLGWGFSQAEDKAMCELYARLAECFKGIHSTKVVSEVWHGNLSLRKKLGRAIRGWLAKINPKGPSTQ